MFHWTLGTQPVHLSQTQVNQLITLFKEETGEVYSEHSIRHLPIPQWGGNLFLKHVDATDDRIYGVIWSTPFQADIVRVAAFVISKVCQNQGYGSQAWNLFTIAALEAGFQHVQLEVKADNEGAQRFYQRRNMSVQRRLDDYYSSGLGFMMKGPLAP